jgi:hypothetical protein
LNRRTPCEIILTALGVLALCCWTRPGVAYVPPLNDLQAQATSYSITYRVTDPERGLQKETWVHPSALVPGGAIVIQHLTVKDGVVAWIDGYRAPSDPAYVYSVHVATYDPLLGVWKRQTVGAFSEIASLATSAGVVAWSGRTAIPRGIKVYFTIYHPILGSWTTDAVAYLGATGSLPEVSVGVIGTLNPSVRWTFDGGAQWYGFHTRENLWFADSWTWKAPFFAAQPLSGKAPLKVWFTDLSIAGEWWSWDFGDGAGASAERSPSHVFTRPGVYTVTQTIGNTESSPEESFTRTITVRAALAGILPLLLDD